MNAKKIMGAVLVALLAAALFVGAGAAVTTEADGGIVFVNQMVSKTIYGGNWVGPNGAYTPADVPAASATEVYFGEAGTYTAKVNNQTITLTVKAPELVIAGVVDGKYTFIPGDFYKGSGEGVIYIQNPASNAVTYTLYYNGEKQNNNTQITVPNDATTGEKTIQAEFNARDFVVGTTPEQLITAPVTFSVVDGGIAVAISAAETSVLKSDDIKLTVTGQPGIAYNVTFDYGAFTVAEQIGFNNFTNINGTVVDADADQKTGIQFTMPAGGKATFNIKAVEAVAGDSGKITVQAVGGTKKAYVTIEFKKGTISAKADAASYYVGDIVTITGTRTTGQISNLTIKGTNFVNETLMDYNTVFAWENSGENFEFTLDTSKILDNGKRLDVGAYTLTLNASGTKATVPLVLKQPFISIVDAPEVIVQDTEAKFIINAEAAAEIAYYIFGTNYFEYGKTENHPEDDKGEEILTQFVVELNETQTKGMDAEQYFAVFQHPMYDKELNIEAVGTAIMLGKVTLFNVDVRQTANAAQALCNALDTQNIDDIYVKYSFFVVGESFTISDIPTEVAKGDKIVISGVDTANAGKTVQVEMISTAFAAVPKETVGSASFIVEITEVAKDGSWEITLDTSDLKVDGYSLSVAINSVEKKNVNVNVVEGADEPVNPEQPEQPEQPEEPVAPATPGFGALAALAGLGAVAVLLLRRE